MNAGVTPTDRPYTRQEVVEILKSAVGRVGDDDAGKLRTQLSDLANYMDTLRHELAQLRSIEISHNHIPAATDELDAVIAETAAATGTIMDACERLQTHANDAPDDLRNAVESEVTAIFEACSFQDITGQRISKVVKALKNIENKVSDILSALGHTAHKADQAAAAASASQKAPTGDAALLNGPQLSGKAISQDEIDKLLASFD